MCVHLYLSLAPICSKSKGRQKRTKGKYVGATLHGDENTTFLSNITHAKIKLRCVNTNRRHAKTNLRRSKTNNTDLASIIRTS